MALRPREANGTFQDFQREIAKQYLLVCPRCAHEPFSISMDGTDLS